MKQLEFKNWNSLEAWYVSTCEREHKSETGEIKAKWPIPERSHLAITVEPWLNFEVLSSNNLNFPQLGIKMYFLN